MSVTQERQQILLPFLSFESLRYLYSVIYLISSFFRYSGTSNGKAYQADLDFFASLDPKAEVSIHLVSSSLFVVFLTAFSPLSTCSTLFDDPFSFQESVIHLEYRLDGPFYGL